jgi:hypothetical protein
MGGEWSASRPGRALPLGKDPPLPLDRRLGGLQSRSRNRGYRTKTLLLPGIEPRSPGRPVRSQTLYWLSYPVHECKTFTSYWLLGVKWCVSLFWGRILKATYWSYHDGLLLYVTIVLFHWNIFVYICRLMFNTIYLYNTFYMQPIHENS